MLSEAENAPSPWTCGSTLPTTRPVHNGHIRLIKIPAEFQLANLLTEGLRRRQFESCLYSLLGEEDPPSAGGLGEGPWPQKGPLGRISSRSHVGPWKGC